MNEEPDLFEGMEKIDRDREIRLIRERPDWMLDQNRDAWERGIESIKPKERLWRYRRRNRVWDGFSDRVLSNVVHMSTANICDVGAEATLLAPSVLGRESHSGELDKQIGNTDYVFGCFLPFRSRSAMGTNLYSLKIDPNNIAHVSPSDIADLIFPSEISKGRRYEDVQLLKYRRNILRLSDFSELFEKYCKVIFNTPDQAIKVLAKNWFYPARADAWSERGLGDGEFGVEFLRKMSELFINHGIVPPVAPEVQVKRSVSARRMTKEELDNLEF